MMGMIILPVVLTKRKNSPDRHIGKMKFFQVPLSLGRILSSGRVGSEHSGQWGTLPQVCMVGLVLVLTPWWANFPPCLCLKCS